MQINAKDIASGMLFIIVGLAYFWMAWTGLPIGSALEMGPGYFPVVLSAILVIFGMVIAFRGFHTAQETAFGRVPWRAVVMLSMATFVFAAFFDDLGLLPGVFVLCLLAALSSSRNTIFKAVVTSLCIAIFCTVVFGYGIGLPVPVVGPLFKF
jgi:Tripartite tricarboxylate transporter TctB family